MMNADKEMAVQPDYKAEAERLAMECNRLADELCKMEEKLFQANIMLEDQSKSIAHLEGQVKAFEFCVARGAINDK